MTNVSSLPNNVANVANVAHVANVSLANLAISVISVSNSNVYVCSININEIRRKV